MLQSFYSNGKILLTGEYFVLHGAKALALPLNVGQSLKIEFNNSNFLEWETFELGEKIFSSKFDSRSLNIINFNDIQKSNFIAQILKKAKETNSAFLNNDEGFKAVANIEFEMNWGLGTSSTLINNIAQWAKVDPFHLNNLVSKGSGYDIACASAIKPIVYQLTDEGRNIESLDWSPIFVKQLSLVYLNKKMATENNISEFLKQSKPKQSIIQNISNITQEIIKCQSISDFMQLIDQHEIIIATALNQPTVKQQLFPDFKGSIKSLGAWGGDFILVASHLDQKKQKDFFNNNGFEIVIPFNDLMKK